MTREEIEKEYTVENGRIVSPGKFEGEPVYVPYFWDLFLNGIFDTDDGLSLEFIIDENDIAIFPELAGYKRIYLYESDDGFVHHDLVLSTIKPKT